MSSVAVARRPLPTITGAGRGGRGSPGPASHLLLSGSCWESPTDAIPAPGWARQQGVIGQRRQCALTLDAEGMFGEKSGS